MWWNKKYSTIGREKRKSFSHFFPTYNHPYHTIYESYCCECISGEKKNTKIFPLSFSLVFFFLSPAIPSVVGEKKWKKEENFSRKHAEKLPTLVVTFAYSLEKNFCLRIEKEKMLIFIKKKSTNEERKKCRNVF